ncbi:MAG TPA: hypothetical protein VGM13_10480 [Thermoanaerobaculia bacterium]|jgi:hypothetical protein
MRIAARTRVLALIGAAALVPSLPAPAQVSVQFHFGEDDYHRIDGRHPLRGGQYQTMASLAHMLDETAQELNRQAYRAARREGNRSQMRVLASVSDFARRAADFHNRMDGYLNSPWDMRREVDDLTRRAGNVNQSVVNARLFPRTYDLWNSEIDLLNRMQQVLHGVVVEIPPSPVGNREDRDWREHRDLNNDGIPDDQQRDHNRDPRNPPNPR